MIVRLHDDSLLVEPTKPTARQRLIAWRQEHPNGTREEARNFLQSENICRRSVAFKINAEEWK